ncbi:MAG: ATP-binding protein [Candidatus Thiodiazotropha sp.]|jgi:signal transduction histidine kinase
MTEYNSLHVQVLENIPDGITIQDKDFNIIYQNAAMKQAFGNKLGHKCFTSYEGRKQVCEGCGLLKAFETGSPTMVHRTGVTEEAGVLHWENSCFPLFDEEGKISAGVEVCRNVTDRVSLTQEVRDRSIELGKLNDQLSQQKRELIERTRDLQAAYEELQRTHTHMLQQEKMASIGQLASGIAHEINTPIQFVGNNIAFVHESLDELLSSMRQCKEKLNSTEIDESKLSDLNEQFASLFEELDFEYLKQEVPLALEQAADGTRRVAEIVLAMKNFAHSGDTTLAPVELDSLIRTTVEVSRNVWRGIADVEMKFETPPLVVKGVWSDLGQVLLNLITNAVDAIIDSRQSESELGRIRILTRQKGNWIEVLVKDSGCGIEPSLIKRIFEPFFTTKDVGRGSGQGLAIAYGILTEEHGGELLVESEPKQGSTFIMRLPKNSA